MLPDGGGTDVAVPATRRRTYHPDTFTADCASAPEREPRDRGTCSEEPGGGRGIGSHGPRPAARAVRAGPLVRPSEHADFQSNVAVSVAKAAGLPPRDLALALQRELDGAAVASTLSGPGFLNLSLDDARLWRQVDRGPSCRAGWAVRADGRSERVRPRSGSYAERDGC
ncbi:hypothetical protein OG689_05790 [Kitasatospora sp. NBC_00240]|uniref:hypothetical protein n=1 Tax=Kitasatospora sp. NBC_00240 TaxID=2903567 RepID=UPI00224EBCD8|nr:hypothetical protein [Kitasatospora sp. NBC_00240]MCX5208807.1 hypothetical protein [Kitasatospora sp. NBC_00240]